MGPDLKEPGGEPVDEPTLSYDADLDADVRSAFDEVEKSKPAGPDVKVAREEVDAPASEQDKALRPDARRDEKGRFTKADRDRDGGTGDRGIREPSAADQGPADPAAAAAQPGAAAPAPTGPPPGWSVASKATWDALPDHIRADIVKREGEVAQGLAALRDYKDLKPYAEMAQKSGITLSNALGRYVEMETLVRRDPGQGMMQIAKNTGLSQAQAAQLFTQLGQLLGGRPTQASQSNGGLPSTSGADQNDPLAEVIGPLIERAIGPMAQKFGAFEAHLTRQQQADQNAREQRVSKAIEAFAADPKHRYFPELEETISRLFETGMVEHTADPAADLAKAYEMAAYQHPDVREALVSERLKAKADAAKATEQKEGARARAASRSITGSATDGSDASPRGKRRQGLSYDADLMADVRAAVDTVSGRA